ncbi:MAG: GxxExxY protein [Opitutales bacterium]
MDTLSSTHRAQLLTNMKLSKISVGLLMNFNVKKLTVGRTF